MRKVIAPIFSFKLRTLSKPITIFESDDCSIKIQTLSKDIEEFVCNHSKKLDTPFNMAHSCDYEFEFSHYGKINENKLIVKSKYALLWAWQAVWLSVRNNSFLSFWALQEKSKALFKNIGQKKTNYLLHFFGKTGLGSNNYYRRSFSEVPFRNEIPKILNIVLQDINKIEHYPPESPISRFRHWHYAAITENEISIRLVLHIAALQCLFGYKGFENNITNFISRYNPQLNKKSCKVFIGKLSGLRDKLIHGGALYDLVKTKADNTGEFLKWIEDIYSNMSLVEFFCLGKKARKSVDKITLNSPPWS